MQTAKYGSYGIVNVLVIEGALAQIQPTEGDMPFWVRAAKLKPIKEPKPQAVVVVSDEPDAWTNFVNYLNGVGYSLRVYSRVDGIEQVQAEYLTWSGESIDDDLIRLYDNKPVSREWRLAFSLGGNVVVPFPIEIGSTTGKRPTNKPRGLFYGAHHVEVCFASIIEQLVRAGLRVTA